MRFEGRRPPRRISNLYFKWKHYCNWVPFICMYVFKENDRNYIGQSWRRGAKCDYKTDCLWVRSPLEMKYLLKFIFPFLCSGVENMRIFKYIIPSNGNRTQNRRVYSSTLVPLHYNDAPTVYNLICWLFFHQHANAKCV